MSNVFAISLSSEWCVIRYYIGYKSLKKRIKHYSGRVRASGVTDDERHEIVKAFSELLDSQVLLCSLAIAHLVGQ